MIRRRPYHCLTALLCAFFLLVGIAGGPPPSYALDLGGVLGKVLIVGGVAFIVKQFGPDIDRFINSVLSQKGIAREGMTKVVPIIRVGTTGTAVGAAQVIGPEQQVKKVQAVAELELTVGSLRGRGLIPVTTKKVSTDTVRGVGGVGISANIKIPL
ncbi:MAG: hypothetical protein HPY44_22135 [Armatimonadetes bacterium]|nr:hypothetical protein [Armatimonadota bacterium]